MKLSTCTNLLLGGIATMAFNPFTSTPTFFVMARGSKDQKGTVASRGPKVTKAPNASRGPKETKAPNASRGLLKGTKAPNVASRGPKETKAPKGTKAPNASRGLKETKAPKGTKAPNASRGLKETKATKGTKSPNASRGLKETKAPKGTKAPNASRGLKETKATKGTKAPSASRGLKETKAPNASRVPKETKAPKGTKAPNSIRGLKETKALNASRGPKETKAPKGSKGDYSGGSKSGKGSKGGYYSGNNDSCIWLDEYVNDEETPQDFYGCVEKFTDGIEELSYNDVMDCTVSIENVWEKCPYFLLDYNDYINAPNNPFNSPGDYAACKALHQCASSVYAIDECFGDEGIDMEGMLANIKDVDVDDVMNAYNAENYDYVSGVFKEIITYGRENNVTDPSIQKSIMCIADNFL